ncbi:hypothetical protein PYW08_014080 [Mythimna loreyi]|uniref:Uncharacterized protein n=1 Tax=Mythimna loreyi TaxID=667449 RepID=A0ACC2R720_9NEOP|nr:hypothetical protein PYW08_014080 [Mythimna loreyi]
MWRTVLGLSVFLYALVSHVTTAPAYYHARGPSYTLTNAPEELQTKPYLEVRNSTYHGSGPREEARAMCSVRTQEVNATANATITRRLHGVVTSRELHTSIQRLEVIIYGQMQQLWQSLDALRTQLTPRVPRSYNNNNHNNLYPSRNTVSFRYTPRTYQPHAL